MRKTCVGFQFFFTLHALIAKEGGFETNKTKIAAVIVGEKALPIACVQFLSCSVMTFPNKLKCSSNSNIVTRSDCAFMVRSAYQ